MTAEIHLDETVRPGGNLCGRVVLLPRKGDEDRRVELSVLWQTSGKGDTDEKVIRVDVLIYEYETLLYADCDPGDYRFEARLPLLPLSYDGDHLQVRWLVRVKRFHPRGSDEVIEETFRVEPFESTFPPPRE